MEIRWPDHIHSDPKVLLGKPTIKGTRISVELILELLASGWNLEMILESYPNLTEENLKAVFAYLNDCLQQELYFPITKTA
ncbi:DUF433 domain-containing protein [soil metagenome]|jgi:uncharacterized protein (DUF433 family)